MNLLPNLKKAVVAVALGALAFAGVSNATVSSAVAQGAMPNIDSSTGSIIIHKFANPDSGVNGVGTRLPKKPTNPAKVKAGKTYAPETEPVPGVVFTYQKVDGVELNTNEGWAKATKLQVDADGSVTFKLNEDGSQDPAPSLAAETEFPATDAKGIAKARNLPLGVYLVKEKSAPKSVLTKSAPFLVTVPFPQDDDAAWIYEVNVYPKNTVVTDAERPHKKINDEGAIHYPGDEISWTVTQTIPQLASDETLNHYEFNDILPLSVNPIADGDKDTKIVVKVKQGDADADPAPVPTKTVAGQKVTVSFTGDELAKLKAGQVVEITLTTNLKDSLFGQDSVANQSVTTINDRDYHSVPPNYDYGTNGDPDDPTKDDSNRPGATQIDLGELQIFKKNDHGTKLKGAEFQVAPAIAGACTDAAFAASNHPYKKVLTTNDDGEASLKVVAGDYCVKETKAPIGYMIDPNLNTTKVYTVAKGAIVEIHVVNQQYKASVLPNLPLTGASGFIILLLGGSAVIALAVGTGFVATSRRKRNS